MLKQFREYSAYRVQHKIALIPILFYGVFPLHDVLYPNKHGLDDIFACLL